MSATPRPTSSRVLPGLLLPVLVVAALAACGEDGPTSAATETSQPSVTRQPQVAADLLATDLPLSLTANSNAPAFEIKQAGGGIAGRFEITSPNNGAIALDAVSSGLGHALLAWNLGLGRAELVTATNPANTQPALEVSSQSLGTASNVSAASFQANNSDATAPAVAVLTRGSGAALLVNHLGTAGDLAVFQVDGVNQVRFSHDGAAYFNGGTKNKGADVAEAFAAEGRRDGYQPGDVLVISTRSDRTVALSDRPYSTRVIGVYATKPGVLLTETDVDNTGATVPLGVVGVIPTKVSAENGPIHRGDVLVSGRTPGHAMRGTRRSRLAGATIGKALEEFAGPGTGMIRVLVNVQ